MTSNSKGFPDENARPSEKEGKEWRLAYAKAAWDATQAMAVGQLGYVSRHQYQDLWDYALGRQDIEYYVKLSGIDPKHEIFNGQHNTRLPLSNRVFNIITGLVEKQGWKIIVNTIDPQAKLELKQKDADRRVRLMMRQVAPDMSGHPQIAPMPGEGQIDDLEGMDVMAMGERHPIAADAQDVIRAIFNYNKYTRVRREAIQWEFVAGASVVKDSTEADGIPIDLIPLGDFVIPYCRRSDFSDAPYQGHVKRVLISELPRLSGGKLSKEDLELARAAGRSWYETADYSDDSSWWTSATCEVLDLEIKSLDTERKEEYTNREGNTRYRDVVVKKDGGEKEVQGAKKLSNSYECLYNVQWIIGTDLVFGPGRALNQKRDPDNEARVLFSYHITAPGIQKMIPFSRQLAIKPMVDDMQVINYRIRWTLAQVIRSGSAIDLDALEDIDLGGLDGKMTKREVLDLYSRTGNLLYRPKSLNGQKTNNLPVIPLQGGVGNEFEEYDRQWERNKQLIRETLGLNDITDASTPNAKNLNSTNQAAMLGTNNALSDMFFSDKQRAEDTAASVLIRAWDMLRFDDDDNDFATVLAGIVGQDTVDRLRASPRLDARRFGITIEDDPSPADIEDFNNSLNEAMAANQITIDEKFMAKSIASENLLQAQIYLAYRVRKNIQRNSEEAARREQSNGQLQIQSAQETEKAKQGTIQLEYKLKSELSAQEFQQQLQLGSQTGAFGLEEQRIGGTARVISANSQANERDSSNMRDNTAKLIKDGHGKSVNTLQPPTVRMDDITPITDSQHPALPQAAFRFIQPINPLQGSEPMSDNEVQEQNTPEMTTA